LSRVSAGVESQQAVVQMVFARVTEGFYLPSASTNTWVVSSTGNSKEPVRKANTVVTEVA